MWLLIARKTAFCFSVSGSLVAPSPFLASGLPVGVPDDALVVLVRNPFQFHAMVLSEFFGGPFRAAATPATHLVRYLGIRHHAPVFLQASGGPNPLRANIGETFSSLEISVEGGEVS